MLKTHHTETCHNVFIAAIFAKFIQLNLSKIIKIVATRYQNLMHSVPGPAKGAYIVFPYSLAGFKGPILIRAGKGGEGKRVEWKVTKGWKCYAKFVLKVCRWMSNFVNNSWDVKPARYRVSTAINS